VLFLEKSIGGGSNIFAIKLHSYKWICHHKVKKKGGDVAAVDNLWINLLPARF